MTTTQWCRLGLNPRPLGLEPKTDHQMCNYLMKFSMKWHKILPDPWHLFKTGVLPLCTSILTLRESSADNFCKQFGTWSGPTKCQAWSGSKLFDTLMIFLKELFEKVDFEKNRQTTKKIMKKYPACQELIFVFQNISTYIGRLFCWCNRTEWPRVSGGRTIQVSS